MFFCFLLFYITLNLTLNSFFFLYLRLIAAPTWSRITSMKPFLYQIHGYTSILNLKPSRWSWERWQTKMFFFVWIWLNIWFACHTQHQRFREKIYARTARKGKKNKTRNNFKHVIDFILFRRKFVLSVLTFKRLSIRSLVELFASSHEIKTYFYELKSEAYGWTICCFCRCIFFLCFVIVVVSPDRKLQKLHENGFSPVEWNKCLRNFD